MSFRAQLRGGRFRGVLRWLGYGAIAVAVLLLPIVASAELGAPRAIGCFVLLIATIIAAAIAQQRKWQRDAGSEADTVNAWRSGPTEPSLPAAVALGNPVGATVFTIAGLFVALTAGYPLAYAGWIWFVGSLLTLALYALHRRRHR